MKKIILLLSYAFVVLSCNTQNSGWNQLVDDAQLTNSSSLDLNEQFELSKIVVFISTPLAEGCNGIFIAPFKILTSAHCFLTDDRIMQNKLEFSSDMTKIYFDQKEVSSQIAPQITGQQIKSVIIHPDFVQDRIARNAEKLKLANDKSAQAGFKLMEYSKSDLAIITLDPALLSESAFTRFSKISSVIVIDDGSIGKWTERGRVTPNTFEYALNIAYTFYTDTSGTSLQSPQLRYAISKVDGANFLTNPLKPYLIDSSQSRLNILESMPDKGRVRTCSGDSGSPLLFKLTNSNQLLLVGLNLGGLRHNGFDDACSSITFYSQLSWAKDWMAQHLTK